jgi:flagellar basal-body rod protein FlgC
LLSEQQTNQGSQYVGGVKVAELIEDPTAPAQIYDPSNPKADENGLIYLSNVNEVSEMVDMMASARSYQNNVEVINTARELMMRTLDLTKV